MRRRDQILSSDLCAESFESPCLRRFLPLLSNVAASKKNVSTVRHFEVLINEQIAGSLFPLLRKVLLALPAHSLAFAN